MNIPRILTFFVSLGLISCAGDTAVRKFESTEIVWEDSDRHPIPEPDEYWSGLYWDGADKMVFRPLSHFWLFEEAGPASNTNALDEVPNSSWYTNRMAIRDISPERVVEASCEEYIDTSATWLVKSGKVDGANPGFQIQDTSTGERYLLKFDSEEQQERATAADVIGSKIYWGAGFSVPCNQVVFFDPANLKIDEDATKKDDLGRKTPLTPADVEKAIEWAPELADGRIRGSASLFLPGKPLGPFTYEETRDADPNDVIPHEDRRELRGSKVIAAWLNHFDAREQNTFTTFIADDEREGMGYIQHHMLDWGDCFGSQWPSDLMTRRFGHSWYFHAGHVGADFISLGLIPRPWDDVKEYPEDGPIFGYYDVANFEPDEWHNGYPHPAFSRADMVDKFWGAKIVSRFTDDHIRALVAEAKFSNPVNTRYLERTLMGRRDKIVRYYFEAVSPLDLPRTRGSEVCVTDLGVDGGYYELADSYYEVRVWPDDGWSEPTRVDGSSVCFDAAAADRQLPAYTVVEMQVRRTNQARPAESTKFHFYVVDGNLRIAGIDRYPAE